MNAFVAFSTADYNQVDTDGILQALFVYDVAYGKFFAAYQ